MSKTLITCGLINKFPSVPFCRLSFPPQNYVNKLIVVNRALSFINLKVDSPNSCENDFLGVYLS